MTAIPRFTLALILGCLTLTSRDPLSAQEPPEKEPFPFGVQIHFREKTFDIPNVSTWNEAAAIACGVTVDGGTRIICSIGDGVRGKVREMGLPGEDPGDCVVFFDPDSSRIERIDYHQPRPDLIALSSDGRYAAMASQCGWTIDDAGIPEVRQSNKTRLTVPEINSRLRKLTRGTLRYSIWEISPLRPIWEMRFYGKTVEAGASARFERPWDGYSKMALPWWAIDKLADMNRECSISFSPDSKYFVGLDPCHGVLILNVASGKQSHCCAAEPNKAPMFFTFSPNGKEIVVVSEDSHVRSFNLEDGKESRERIGRLPMGATIKLDEDEILIANFTPVGSRGLLGVDDGDGLWIGSMFDDKFRKVSIASSRKEVTARKVEQSIDGRYLGISYGFFSGGSVSVAGRTRSYEVADMATGQIVRRVIGSKEDATASTSIQTLVVKGSMQACLGIKDSEMVYVVPLTTP